MKNQSKWILIGFPIMIGVLIYLGLLLWRWLFVFYNGVDSLLSPIIAGFRLDWSMTAGVLLLLYFPYLIYIISGKNWAKGLLYGLTLILWTFVSITELSSILLYKEWGSTLDARAVSYLAHPGEAWASVRDFIPWLELLLGLVIFWGIIFLITQFFNWVKPFKIRNLVGWSWLILLGPLLFLMLRGGWQKLPVTPSDAYYSTDMKRNLAAVNKVWYFIYSMIKSGKNDLRHSSNTIAMFEQEYQESRCTKSDKDGSWTDKNVVLVVMEGWSADMVDYLYGKENVTPFFDSLSNHSIRFTNAFSTGFRTDQGVASILSGVPSMESLNVPNVISKVPHLPSLPSVMKSAGRSVSFIYGGDLNFSNLYNFLTTLGVDTIIRQEDFDRKYRTTDWGVPDHITVHKGIEVMNTQDAPFFSMMLLLSSHAPFEIPYPNDFSGQEDNASKYKASVKYSDSALKVFFDDAQLQPWYDNTVFIITADHGSTHSGWAGMEDQNRFRIPLIVFDPSANRVSPEEVTVPCDHFDLPLTICKMTGADATPFLFSRNIFCSATSQFAYFNSDHFAGRYGLTNNCIQLYDTTAGTGCSPATLFLDMIKSWYNHLGN